MSGDRSPDRPWCRRRSLSEMAAILEASASRFGVARIGAITRLDGLGIPAVTVVRADPVGESVSVCTGKGATELEARVGALAEALERYCAEPRDRIEIITAPRQTQAPNALAPELLTLPADATKDAPLDWVRGSTLAGAASRAIWIPANAVFFPYRPRSGASALFASHTTGIATGATVEEALVFGLLECIERDAYSRAVALASAGRGEEIPVIAIDDGRRVASEEIDALVRSGMRFLIRDLTCDTGVPTYLCTISDGFHAHSGCTARPNAVHALREAIREATQSRLTDIQGAREDLAERGLQSEIDDWFLQPGASPTAAVRQGWCEDDAVAVLDRLNRQLRVLPQPVETVWVDLSLEGVDAAVVRAITPGLEIWAFDPTRAGMRGQSWLCPPEP
jgi:YcaO-like protein with predicted kinase domain